MILILNSLCVVVRGGDRIKEAVSQVVNINSNNLVILMLILNSLCVVVGPWGLSEGSC